MSEKIIVKDLIIAGASRAYLFTDLLRELIKVNQHGIF